MAFMFIGTDNFRIHQHMVGNQGVGHDALFQAEVFG
jgi:hypothetical protein